MTRDKTLKAMEPRTKARISLGKRLRESESGTTDLDAWRELLDPKRTSVADFLYGFDITTEESEDDVPFDLYPFQIQLTKDTDKQWAEGRAAKFRVPKSRRRGVSRYWQGRFFERAIRKPGWKGVIIAQDDPHAQMHMADVRELVDQLPEDTLKRLNIRIIIASARQVVFKHGVWRKSSITVKTASTKGLQRGGKLNGILQTERPHWADKAKEDRASFLRSCRNSPGNIVVDESSAKGYDEFFKDCMKSRDGIGDHQLVFLPSHHHKLNRRPFRTAKARETLEADLGKEKRYGFADEEQCHARVLRHYQTEEGEADAVTHALEYMHWRRYTIDDDCEYVAVYHREEPTTLEEAFQGAGRRVLPVEIMESWVDAAKRKSEGARVGRLVLNSEGISFVEDREGLLTVFEEPGEVVSLGVDVASGKAQRSGGKEADYQVADFGELFSGRQVAQFRGHVYAKQFCRQIMLAAAWYRGGTTNCARGYIEINYPTVVSHMVESEGELDVLGITPEDVMLTSDRKVKTKGKMTNVGQFGFYTTEKSKGYLVSLTTSWMKEWGEIAAGDVVKECPVGLETLDEMLRFVRTDAGKMEAEEGFDDRVMAMMLRLMARDELLNSGEEPMSSRVPEREVDPMLAHFIRKRAEAERPDETPIMQPHPQGGKPIAVTGGGDAEPMPGMPGF